jgi:hypothetical protein
MDGVRARTAHLHGSTQAGSTDDGAGDRMDAGGQRNRLLTG